MTDLDQARARVQAAGIPTLDELREKIPAGPEVLGRLPARKERPILFSAPMVLALLAGTKTQTRRVVKPQPENDPAKHHPIKPYNNGRGGWNWVLAATGHGLGDPFPCPYGQPGDRLWVREAWAYGVHAMAAARDEDGPFVYAADHSTQSRLCDRWRPSIHMPRAASRITLEVIGVRVERLWDISEADAIAEGIERSGECNWRDYLDHPHNDFTSARRSYRSLWDQINGAGAWDLNPWAWAVSFRVIKP